MTAFMAFLAKNWKTLFIGIIALLAFMILVNGCTRPSKIWNWNRVRIWNRGDGNVFDIRSWFRNRTNNDSDGDGERRPWNLTYDNGMPTDDAATQQIGSESMDSNVLIWAGIIVAVALIFWFFILSPETRARILGKSASTEPSTEDIVAMSPSDPRMDMFAAYCRVHDHLPVDVQQEIGAKVLPYIIEDVKARNARVIAAERAK